MTFKIYEHELTKTSKFLYNNSINYKIRKNKHTGGMNYDYSIYIKGTRNGDSLAERLTRKFIRTERQKEYGC